MQRNTRQLEDMHRPMTGRRRAPSGVVLFVVMIVCLMLSLAGLASVAMLTTENRATHLRGDELRIECVAGSGAELVKAVVGYTPSQRAKRGGVYDNSRLFRGVQILDPAVDGRGARFSVVSPKIEADQISGVRFGLTNESAKLNLAVLPQWEEDNPGSGRAALMRLPGMTRSMAESILDWVDGDTSARPSGAESSYYSQLGVPYGPRNGVPSSLEELLLVREVTRDLVFGADRNFNGRKDAGESTSSLSAGDLPWASLLTVYSVETNRTSKGRPKIDLNDRNLATLHKQLIAAFDTDWADFIILYRQYGPSDEKPTSENRASAKKIEVDLSVPAKFTLDSPLDLVGANVQLPKEEDAGKEKGEEEPQLLLGSPLGSSRKSMAADLPRLLDAADTNVAPIVRGRVNINEAPRVVLRGIPGMTSSVVERIVSGRPQSGSSSSSGREHPIWLLTDGLVKLEVMKKLLPYVTTGGDVYRGQIVAFFDDGGPFARMDIVVDGTTNPPRQVYHRDLRLLGLGFSPQTLGGQTMLDPLDTLATEQTEPLDMNSMFESLDSGVPEFESPPILPDPGSSGMETTPPPPSGGAR